MPEKTFQERVKEMEVDKIYKEMIHEDLIRKRITLAEEKECPLCLKWQRPIIGKMRIKVGPYGPFLTCNQFPTCKFSWNAPNLIAQLVEKNKQNSDVRSHIKQ